MLLPQRLIFQIRGQNFAWNLIEFKWFNDTQNTKIC